MRTALSLIVVAFALLIAPAHEEPGTPRAAAGYARRVVDVGLLELPPDSTVPSVVQDGRRRADVSLLDVAVALPGAIAARFVRADARVRAGAAMLIPVTLLASIAGVFFARLRRRHGLDLRLWSAVGATMALVFTTSLVAAMRRPDATLVATLALLLLVDRLGSRPESRRMSHFVEVGLLAATIALAQPAYELPALALLVLDVLRRKSAPGGVVALALLAVATVGARIWTMRAGAVTPSSGAPFHVLYGLLLSPGRSLFVYSPVALLGVITLPRLWALDRHRTEAIALVVVTALLAITLRADWHGDPAYGPPLVVPLLPLLVEPAALLLSRRGARTWFILASFTGVAIQLLGVAVDVEAWPRLVADVRAATGAPGWFLDPAADMEFVPQLSPVVGQATLLPIALGRAPKPTPPFSLVVGGDQAGTGDQDAPWKAVAAKLDRATLRPNLTLAQSSDRVARALFGAWAGISGLAFMWMARSRRKDTP